MEEYKFTGARLMPVLPIRGISVFPGTMLTFDVERPASKAALNAALNPDLSYIRDGYLYFCATEPTSGVLAFARTEEEHKANVAKYRPLWEEYDRQNASN